MLEENKASQVSRYQSDHEEQCLSSKEMHLEGKIIHKSSEKKSVVYPDDGNTWVLMRNPQVIIYNRK